MLVEQSAARPRQPRTALERHVLRLVEDGAAVSGVLEGAEGAAAEQFAVGLVVQLRAQLAAGQVRVAVIQAAGEYPIARGVAGLRLADRGGGQARCHVAGHRGVIAVALQLEAVHRELQPPLAGKVVAELGEQVVAGRIHQVSLRAVHADQPAVRVGVHAALTRGHAHHRVERPLPRAQHVRAAVAQAVGAAGRGAGIQRHALGDAVLVRSAPGDDVDDAASGAKPLQRVGALDDLDALDHRRIDRVRIARSVAQRAGLRHAVDHVQRTAPAQGFAAAGQFLGGGREGGQQGADRLRQVRRQGQLLAQLLLIDHGDRHRQRALAARHAQRALGHLDALQLHRLRGVGGMRRDSQRAQDGQGNGADSGHATTPDEIRRILTRTIRNYNNRGVRLWRSACRGRAGAE